MDFDQILQMLSGLVSWGPMVLQILGGVVVLGQIIVAATPSTADDDAWAKMHAIPLLGSLLQSVAKMAPFQKKP
jgi:hypothetical protein